MKDTTGIEALRQHVSSSTKGLRLRSVTKEEEEEVSTDQWDTSDRSYRSSSQTEDRHIRIGRSKWLVTTLIMFLGAAACASFLAFGITSIFNDSSKSFTTKGEELFYHMQTSWATFEMFGLWMFESCHKSDTPNLSIDPSEDIASHLGYCSRDEFRNLYEYIRSQGVEFASAQFVRNITHEYREIIEAESRAYYAEHYPNFTYNGITGTVPKANGESGVEIVPWQKADFYLPIHYVEPLLGNERVVELDKRSVAGRLEVQQAMTTRLPVLTQRIKLVQETDVEAYGVILVHPGTKTSIQPLNQTNSAAQIVVRIPQFLQYALRASSESATLYLYDATYVDTNGEEKSPPEFLGAVRSSYHGYPRARPVFESLREVGIEEITNTGERYYQASFEINGRTWTMVKFSDENDEDYLFVILGGSIIFAASLCFACWFHSHLSRLAKYNKLKSDAQAEKAENARIQVMKERELNDFIAHEVRNPLASALSALSFVSSGVSDHVEDSVKRKAIKDDIAIVDSSLQFINELLRNMLDVHRTQSHEINLQMSVFDVRKDILDPVAAILFMRGAKVDITVDCPADLHVESDRMRVKQIMLNLSANSTKFVEQGFIRLRAAVLDDGRVELSVEDSGPGIPEAKRGHLFAKFQESLDSLNQGTGIGLCICKNLSELLKADIGLDENYDSGILGYPGTRFILNLNKPAVEHTSNEQRETEANHHLSCTSLKLSPPPLPETMSILIVDDDTMIRKMFRRAVMRVAPEWTVEEACNGETALQVVDSKTFDLIFVDQYMASIEKQLLGTETTRALRSKGVQSFITGLSANDMETPFLDAGADSFMIKPFPCKTNELQAALQHLLELRDQKISMV